MLRAVPAKKTAEIVTVDPKGKLKRPTGKVKWRTGTGEKDLVGENQTGRADTGPLMGCGLCIFLDSAYFGEVFSFLQKKKGCGGWARFTFGSVTASSYPPSDMAGSSGSDGALEQEGLECIHRCTKEHKDFPKQGNTCCLAMDGVKILASGFEREEKLKIEKLVTAMCGELCTKTSMDISFVVAKDVLAAKYKWALNVLRKPIVTIDWLIQCWREHRLVPYESYRILAFAGLTICATRIPPEKRKEIERHVIQNGGNYSADLTRKCTHLLSDRPEGDKYKVARAWGHIKIVNQTWISQCIAARACLDEESYPVQAAAVLSASHVSGIQGGQCNQDKDIITLTTSQPSSSTPPQHLTSVPSISPATCKEQSETVVVSTGSPLECTGCVAADSQNEDNDLYLENCRILLAGFEATEMRRLVDMVRSGGGSRYLVFNEKLTHIIVGRPSESEMKDIRKLAVWGVVNVVKPVWLDDCTQQKREVAVTQRHTVSESLILQGIDSLEALKVVDSVSSIQEQNSMISSVHSKSNPLKVENGRHVANLTIKGSNDMAVNATAILVSKSQSDEISEPQTCQRLKIDQRKARQQSELESDLAKHLSGTSSEVCNVFKGCRFGFSKAFPVNRRDEIIQWVIQGGGSLSDAGEKQKLDFIIECHGSRSKAIKYSPHGRLISSHWIRYCLEEGVMLDVESHILYKPLPCQIPFPGFENLRFCVSQYEERDRILLRNLCYVLGAKFTGKLNKKVTHLLCKYAVGPKYEAACSWGIESITADWIYECIRQDTVLPLHPFRPREISAEEGNAGFFAMTQYPTQARHLALGDLPSQWQSDSQSPSKLKRRPVELEGEKQEPQCKSAMRAKRGKKAYEPCHVTNGLSKSLSAAQDVPCSSDPWDEQAVQWSGRTENSCKEQADTLNISCKQVRKLQQQATSQPGKVSLMDNTVEELTRGEDDHLVSRKESVASCSRKESIISCSRADANESTAADKTCQIMGKTEGSESPPDVAAAIEDLLAQSSELQSNDSPTRAENDQNLFSPKCSILLRSRAETPCLNFGSPKYWPIRPEKCDNQITSNDYVNQPLCDGFSESQIESQVVGYEEDQTGRQIIMERVRTRSMTSLSVIRNDSRGEQINANLGRLLKAADANN